MTCEQTPETDHALPRVMRAQRIHAIASFNQDPEPLVLENVERPEPAAGEVLVKVAYCGVCRTELDEIEGRTPPARLPMIPGHQVVGEVVLQDEECKLALLGWQVGVAWIHYSCGDCDYCQSGLENLCSQFRGCGRDAPGGYAEFMAVHEDFAHPLPAGMKSIKFAPLLCAGAVGLRAIRLCGIENGQAVGLTGFGASGHLVIQMLRHLFPASAVHVFARNRQERAFALELGAAWAGDTGDIPPAELAAVIDTTPAWKPVVAALAALAPGGCLVINAISKEAGDRDELLSLDYTRHFWREKILRTVTNVTRKDVRDCLQLAVDIPLDPEVEIYPLEAANRALREIKEGGIRGAKVLQID